MAIEQEILPFLDWLLPQAGVGYGALGLFFFRALIVLFIGLFVSYLIAAVRHGPSEAFYLVSAVVADAVTKDLPDFSFRRTWAIARLAILESIRRRVIVVFAAFIVVVMFAGWFLDRQSDNPARLYISFVYSAANLLTLAMLLFLSTFSLPNDVKNKTIYTVVTKPVRAIEIVFGRIVGFALIGTALLLFTSIVSYVFVIRGLAHEHAIEPDSLSKPEIAATTKSSKVKTQVPKLVGKTGYDSLHRHDVIITDSGQGQTDIQKGHWHPVTAVEKNGETTYVVGPHQGMLVARVPHYGALSFLDNEGNPGKGISVGQEWTYRSYVQGGTKAAAVWTFKNVTPARYPNGLELETDIRIFRTYKGNIERGVLGKLMLFNRDPRAKIRSSTEIIFIAVEFELGHLTIPRKLRGIDEAGQQVDIDLFDDLVHNGELDIRLYCAEPQQYFGMAKPDLYVKSTEFPFWQNFAKGYLGIWLQMLVVTALGVTLSTFVSAPVALIGTLGGFILGYFGTFIAEVAKRNDGEAVGGGPIEALLRIITQVGLMTQLEIGDIPVKILTFVDDVLMFIMIQIATLIPNLGDFDLTSYVAYGYNIDANLLTQHVLLSLSFVSVSAIVGYFMLKTREIAA